MSPRICRALRCTGEHCDSCGLDIIGGYPGLDGKPVCYDCPNLAKGTYHITVEVMATNAGRAMQTINHALVWYESSDSNAKVVDIAVKRMPGAAQ